MRYNENMPLRPAPTISASYSRISIPDTALSAGDDPSCAIVKPKVVSDVLEELDVGAVMFFLSLHTALIMSVQQCAKGHARCLYAKCSYFFLLTSGSRRAFETTLGRVFTCRARTSRCRMPTPKWECGVIAGAEEVGAGGGGWSTPGQPAAGERSCRHESAVKIVCTIACCVQVAERVLANCPNLPYLANKSPKVTGVHPVSRMKHL